MSGDGKRPAVTHMHGFGCGRPGACPDQTAKAGMMRPVTIEGRWGGAIERHWVRGYMTLEVPFTNAERSSLRLEPGALFRVVGLSSLPNAPDVDGCIVTFEPASRELPIAIRNPFMFTGTQHVSVAHLPLAEQWEIERQKRLVEHERDRSLWIAEGARLGPITYSETRGDVWGDWHGEWRSAIESHADFDAVESA